MKKICALISAAAILVFSAPFRLVANSVILMPNLSAGPTITMLSLLENDTETSLDVIYENTADANKLAAEIAGYNSEGQYLSENYNFKATADPNDPQVFNYSADMYTYIQFAYSLDGGATWINAGDRPRDFQRQQILDCWQSNSSHEISEGISVDLPTYDVNLNRSSDYANLLDMYVYALDADEADQRAQYLSQGKAVLVKRELPENRYSIDLNLNTVMVKARYVICIDGLFSYDSADADTRKFASYSAWGNTFSFNNTVSPVSMNFSRGYIDPDIADAPQLSLLRSADGAAVYYIDIGSSLHKALAEHQASVAYYKAKANPTYTLEDFFGNDTSQFLNFYVELRINSGQGNDWFSWSETDPRLLIHENEINYKLLTNKLNDMGITLKPSDTVYMRVRLMTTYQTTESYLQDGVRKISVPDENSNYLSAYSNEIILPVSGVYDINYHLNDGEWKAGSYQLDEYGENDKAVIDLTAADYIPEKYGYDFMGWYTSEYFDSGTLINSIDLKIKKFYDIYAKWYGEEYKINYVNGYSGVYNPNPTVYTTKMSDITLEKPTLGSVIFKGWYKNADFSGSPVTVINVADKADITLYAKWELPVFRITYDLAGGTNSTANPAEFTVDPDKDHYAELTAPTRAGYIFDGWYSDAHTEVQLPKKADKWELEAQNDITVYAKWITGRWNINYINSIPTLSVTNPNPSSYTYGDTVKLQPLSLSGFTFSGWYADKELTKAAEDITPLTQGEKTYYAAWSENTYKITYILNADKASSPPTDKIENTNPVTRLYTQAAVLKNAQDKTGDFKFMGWYATVNFTGSPITTVSADADTTLYAKWERSGFPITYELDGGKNSAANPSRFTLNSDGSNNTVLRAAEKANMEFAGWYYDKALTARLPGDTGSQTFKSQTALTVWAKWTPQKYTLSYIHPSGITPLSDGNPDHYYFGDAVTLNSPAAKGYKFDGWYSDTGFTTAAAGVKAGESGARSFYSKWTEKSYNVKYVMDINNVLGTDINSVTNENPINRKFTTAIALKDAFCTLKSYKFVGWYSDKNFEGSVKSIAANTDSDVTLYAKWYKYIWADADMDGLVSAADARLTLRAAIGLDSLPGDIIPWCILSKDASGKLTAADARLILRLAVKLETTQTLGLTEFP